uniref:Fanconi anaemia group A protein N-terminal domain-containing protein n=1 Tax=Cuerna arida TaxID=1464854 RepID=A0A1B6GK61_9HEMI
MTEILSKSSGEEVECLCNDVFAQLTDSSYKSRNNTLNRLRLICGKGECVCGTLTPSQNLSYLLQVQAEKVLDLSIGLSLIHNYTSLAKDKHWQSVLEQMLRLSLTDSPSDSITHFFDQLWKFQGLKFFTISLVEDFIQSKSNYLEEDVFEMFKESLHGTNPSCVLTDEKFERLVYWGSNSPWIFCTVTSVLNTWMQRIVDTTRLYNGCVSVVASFVSKVRLKCRENKRDFVLLYPAELHSIVSLLDIKPTIFPQSTASMGSLTLSTVVSLLEQNLEKKPVQTLCLLTHFPDWSSFLNRPKQ